MGMKAVTGWRVGVEMLQVRQRRMFQSKEINMRAGSDFSDAMEEWGICCKKEIPPKERGGIKHWCDRKGVIGCLDRLPSPPPLHPPHRGTRPQRRLRRRPSGVGHSRVGTPLRCPPPPPGTLCSHSPCRGCRHPRLVTSMSRSKTWSSKESPDPHRAWCPALPRQGCGSRSPPHQARSAPPSAVGPAAPPLPAVLTGSWRRALQRCCGRGCHGGRLGRVAAGGARPGCRGWSTGCPGSLSWGKALHCHLPRHLLHHPRNMAFAGPSAGKAGCGSGPSSREDTMAHLEWMIQAVRSFEAKTTIIREDKRVQTNISYRVTKWLRHQIWAENTAENDKRWKEM